MLLSKTEQLLQNDLSGRVETSFGSGITIVKIGRYIFQLIGLKLHLIATIESNQFASYCGNFFYQNGKHYCADRLGGLFVIDTENKKLIRVEFKYHEIATFPMANKVYFYDFKSGGTLEYISDGVYEEIESKNVESFCLGCLHYQGHKLVQTFNDNLVVEPEKLQQADLSENVDSEFESEEKENKNDSEPPSPKLVLGKYGIMQCRSQIGDYYRKVEEEMRKFVDQHVNSPLYVESELDFEFDYVGVMARRTLKQNQRYQILLKVGEDQKEQILMIQKVDVQAERLWAMLDGLEMGNE